MRVPSPSFLLSILAIPLPLLRHTTNAKSSSAAVGMVGIIVLSLNAASNTHNIANAAAVAPSSSSSSISEDTNVLHHQDDDYEEKDNDYESKIQKALQYFKSKSSQLVQQSIQDGGGVVALVGDMASTTAEITPNGDVMTGSTDDGTAQYGGRQEGNNNLETQLWQTEFALSAMKQELSRLQNRWKRNLPEQDDSGAGNADDSNDHEEEEEEDDDDDDEEEDDEEDEDGDYGDNFPPENYALTPEEINDRLQQHDPELKAILDAIPDVHTRIEKYGDIKSEADMASKMDIANWHKFKYWELHAYFSCARQFAASRPVYDAQMWNEVRQLWNDFANEDKLDNFKPGMADRTYQFGNDSFDPPMEAFHAGEKGRGLRAARDIQRGELVFKATNNTVIFTHGHTWRKFLFHIYERHGEDGPYDGGTACDVLLWSWVQRLERDGPLVIVADLDNGSLLNEGRDEVGWDKPNVRCGKEGDEMCMMEYYAMNDIKTGEEILCDYREFALLGAWRNMGL